MFFFHICNSYFDFSASLLLKLLFGVGYGQGELLSRCRMAASETDLSSQLCQISNFLTQNYYYLYYISQFLTLYCAHSAGLHAILAALSSQVKKALTQHWPSGSCNEDLLVQLYKWSQSQEGQPATLHLVMKQNSALGANKLGINPPLINIPLPCS